MVWSIWARTPGSDIPQVFWTTGHQRQASGSLLLLDFGHLSYDIVVVKLSDSTPSHEKKTENYYLWKKVFFISRIHANSESHACHVLCLWYSLCTVAAILCKNHNPVTLNHVTCLTVTGLWWGCDFKTLVVKLSNYLNELSFYVINIL